MVAAPEVNSLREKITRGRESVDLRHKYGSAEILSSKD